MAHFARGARGALITPLRSRFGLPPSKVPRDPAPDLHDPAFDEFDGDLEHQVRAFQTASGQPPTGVVDPTLYAALTGLEWPDLFERALMVVAAIERHGYLKFLNPDLGTRDPAGLTAGVIGFTATHRSLNKVLALVPDDIVVAACEAHGIAAPEQEAFRRFTSPAVFNGSNAASRRLAIELFQHRGAIVPKWQAVLRDLLGSDAGRSAQHLIARSYFAQGERAATTNGLLTEYGKVLTFSINVQSYLSKKLVSTGSDRERRVGVTLARAGSIAGNMQNFESRHLQLARGRGFPNGQFIDLTAWGFDDPDAPAAERSRVLSIGLSGRASMAALARFERAALEKGVVQESVIASAPVTERLVAASVPFANNGDLDLRTPDLSRAWASGLTKVARAKTRRAFVEVLIALDVQPVDCLVLGGDALGTGKRGGWLWTRNTPLKLCGRPTNTSGGRPMAALAWLGEGLDLSLDLQAPSGLVVLYTTNGVGSGTSFATHVHDAITTLGGNPPVVLGWFGAVALPGRDGPTPEVVFLDAVKEAMTARNVTLRGLVRDVPDAVIQAWGRACFDVYSQHASHVALWRRTRKRGSKAVVASACAALGPDRHLWLAAATPADDIFMERA